MKLILTCEHAGREVPPEYQYLFKNAEHALDSHRGYDPGALDIFNRLKRYAAFHLFHPVSRLVVEVNRSPGHPQLFSEFTRLLPETEKERVLDQYYFPYRNVVKERISELISTGESVLHLSIHSFTPELHGQVRTADVGLLYDPTRKLEKEKSRELKEHLQAHNPYLRIRFNYPYLGKADGLTTFLRKKFPTNYAGIEIEVNQIYSNKDEMAPSILETLEKTISEITQTEQ